MVATFFDRIAGYLILNRWRGISEQDHHRLQVLGDGDVPGHHSIEMPVIHNLKGRGHEIG